MIVHFHRWLWCGLFAFLFCTKTSCALQLLAVAPAPPVAPTPDPNCPATTTPWDKNVNPVAAIMPTTMYDGSVITFRVTGSMNTNWTIHLCPKPTATKTDYPPTVTLDAAKSSASVLQALVTADPGTVGEYAVYLIDTSGKVYDSGKVLEIQSSDDTKFISCAAPANHGKPNANLACSFVPLSYETELTVFGKGVADRFIAVEVIVRNKNASLEYLLQDLRIGTPDFVVSSYDKKIPRAVSEKAEQFSARAILVRLTAATASILTGVAGFAGSEILQQTANIYAGPYQAGLQSFVPD